MTLLQIIYTRDQQHFFSSVKNQRVIILNFAAYRISIAIAQAGCGCAKEATDNS